jgi:hypothetical protein
MVARPRNDEDWVGELEGRHMLFKRTRHLEFTIRCKVTYAYSCYACARVMFLISNGNDGGFHILSNICAVDSVALRSQSHRY